MPPIERNGIVVVVIINAVAAWGEYLLASRLMNEQGQWTLPVVHHAVAQRWYRKA
jgi:ABC-type glycerol-3-phosphate transport system permease component